MILIGSCSRSRLIRSLEERVGPLARQQEANKRQNQLLKDTIENKLDCVEKKRLNLNSIEFN